MPSKEQRPNEEQGHDYRDAELFMRDLEAHPRHDARQLKPHIVFKLPAEHGAGNRPKHLAAIDNLNEGVSQELLAVVRADQDVFGVVRAKFYGKKQKQATDVTEKLAITRFDGEGGRAELVDFPTTGKYFVVGRSHQAGLSEGVSRHHFAVAQAEDGSVGIGDLGSTNGTEVVVLADGEASDEVLPGSFDPNVPNPLDDSRTWSVKSRDLRRQALA